MTYLLDTSAILAHYLDEPGAKNEKIEKMGSKKWGQCANLDKIYLCPILAACHGACASNLPALFTT